MSWKAIALVIGSAAALSACNTDDDSSGSSPVTPTSIQAAGVGTVAEFPDAQVTGLSMSADGRLFASFPRWRDGIPFSVVEISNGAPTAYPDASWNEWAGAPEVNKFISVQAVLAHGGSLFVLDTANPQMSGLVSAPVLYEFDLASNELKEKWSFDSMAAPEGTYLNDLRIDGNMAFITDSGLGAIVVLNMSTGQARRLLADHPSTKAEPVTLVSNGKPFLKPDGQPQRIHSDGIALRNGYLYYHALTGYTLYRVPLTTLTNEALAAGAVAGQVQTVGVTTAPDGMIFDGRGNLFMGDLEGNAIMYRTPDGEMETLLKDAGLHWPDTLTIGGEYLYFTDSLLDEVSPGQAATGRTFRVYRVPLPGTAAAEAVEAASTPEEETETETPPEATTPPSETSPGETPTP